MDNDLKRFNEYANAFINWMESKTVNSYSLLRVGVENEPEKLIGISEMLHKSLIMDPESARLNSIFVDHKEHFERHFHESVFITGDSNIEISIQKHTLLQKVFVLNNSKAVINYNTSTDEPKILQVHLYDNSEVYIDAGNNVDIFMRLMSGNAMGTVKVDGTCNVVKSTYDSAGLIKSVKVKPE